MEKRITYLVFVFLVAGMLLMWSGCHLIFPLSSRTVDAVQHTYFCSAQIYRPLPGSAEFTEEWQAYIWPLRWDSNTQKWVAVDPHIYATQKINEYITKAMAPGFTWHYRNLTVTVSAKEKAVDCLTPATPPTYGAPLGAEIRWNYPPSTEGSCSIWLEDKNGQVRTANPGIGNAYIDLAERTGMPDWEPGGTYQRLKRHARFSDMFLELDTPFALGADMTITDLWVQSIGTIYAEHTGGLDYRIYPGNAKFFIYGRGVKGGDTGVTSFCFWNDISQNFRIQQGPAQSSFAIALNLTPNELDVNMTINISLSVPVKPYPSLKTHQPIIALLDKTVTSVPATLTPDLIGDMDNDLNKILWFKDFETTGEVYLGQGNPLTNVNFSHGSHEITAVACDSKGAYDSDTMTLTVDLTPPNDNCANALIISDGTHQGSTLHATNDGIASCGLSSNTPDVWYKYTPSCSGLVSVDLCGSDYDSVLSVYTTCPQGTGCRFQVICNDDCSDGDCIDTYQSCVKFYASPRQTYTLRVAGYNGAVGNFTLNVGLVPPSNNICNDAPLIGEGTYRFSNCLANTSGPDEPYQCNFFGYTDVDSDIWFRYDPSCSGDATVSLCGSEYDTKLAIYERYCPSRESAAIACNDDYEPCGSRSQVTFPVNARGQYLIRIGGYQGDQGSGVMTIYTNPADLNFDCDANLLDFNIMAQPWQSYCSIPSRCNNGDINHDGIVNLLDLEILCDLWLQD